ncbi:MAG: PH domain-containing protein [Christensenellaceae bacterium]
MKKDDTAPYLWSDRKRILGMPISFTQYKLSKDRLFLQRGLFNTAYDETVLYRIRDISVTISLGQRLFGVGTVLVHSSDKTHPHMALVNIRRPMEVKELIFREVEEQKLQRNYKINEFLDDDCEHEDDGGLDGEA